jgi:outer membrane protein assembly factor BamB
MSRRFVGVLLALTVINAFPMFAEDTGQGATITGNTGGPAESPWPMFGHDARHTGLSPYNTSTNTGHLIWSFQTQAPILGSPVIGLDGTIYIKDDNSELYAINPDGTQKWNTTLGVVYSIVSTPAIASDGTLYAGGLKKLYAINPDGTQKWDFTTFDNVDWGLTIDRDGTIYAGPKDQRLYAINPDGTEKWRWFNSWSLTGSPTIGGDGTIYIGSDDDKLHAINPDGTEKWNFTTGDWVWASAAIGIDGTIYFGSSDHRVYALNPDGTEKWSYLTEGEVKYTSPAIGRDGTIYVGSFDHKLHAINPDGSQKWNFTTGDRVRSTPAIGSDGSIYFGSDDGNIYSINSDGTEKWRLTTGDQVRSSPAIGSDGTIYVGSLDGKLYAIGNSSRPLPPILLDGTLDGLSHQNVAVSWALSPDDGSGLKSIVAYDIQRSLTYESSGIGYGVIATAANGTTEFVDVLAGEGDPNNYFYRVCGVTLAGNTSCAIDQAGKSTRVLSKGPNLVSVPLVQSNESIERVLQTLQFNRVWKYDSVASKWRSYMTSKPYRGELRVVDHSMGVWINVTEESNLTVAGIVPLKTDIQLLPGWNLVGFPSFDQQYLVGELVIDTGAMTIEGFDSSASPYFLRTLFSGDIMRPVFGYWVEVKSEIVWVVENH